MNNYNNYPLKNIILMMLYLADVKITVAYSTEFAGTTFLPSFRLFNFT